MKISMKNIRKIKTYRKIWGVDKINIVSYDIKSIFMSIKENLNEEKK